MYKYNGDATNTSHMQTSNMHLPPADGSTNILVYLLDGTAPLLEASVGGSHRSQYRNKPLSCDRGWGQETKVFIRN